MKNSTKRKYSSKSSSSSSSPDYASASSSSSPVQQKSSRHRNSPKKSRSRSKSRPKSPIVWLQNQQQQRQSNYEDVLSRRKQTRYLQDPQQLNEFWNFPSPFNIIELEQQEFKEFKNQDTKEFNEWNDERQIQQKEKEEKKKQERERVQIQQVEEQGDSTQSSQEEAKHQAKEIAAEEESFCGPQPLKIDSMQNQKQGYGGQLLPGEGKAIASYISEGKRIPRRGEIGLTSDEIDSYEKIGFVMSGSRHSVMNAVRQRKEAQIYTFEESRALHAFNMEKKLLQEYKTIEVLKNQLKTHQNEKN